VEKDLPKLAYDYGFELESTFYGCAQCVIGAVYKVFPEMRNEGIFRSANAQAGGMGLTSLGQCGALVAGGMLLSQLYGRELGNLTDPEGARFEAYRLGAEFLERFTQEVGAVKCSDIQKDRMGKSFDLSRPDQFEEFEELGGHESHCPNVVGTAARIVVQMILEKKEAA